MGVAYSLYATFKVQAVPESEAHAFNELNSIIYLFCPTIVQRVDTGIYNSNHQDSIVFTNFLRFLHAFVHQFMSWFDTSALFLPCEPNKMLLNSWQRY